MKPVARYVALCSLPLALALAGCPSSEMEDAKALAAGGRYLEAGAAFKDIARADPANLAAWDGAIDAFCRKEVRVGECMGVLDLELELLGNLDRHADALSEALDARARARLEQGLVDPALADLARAEKAAPDRAPVLVTKARALIMKGQSEAALEALYRAKKIDPSFAEADEVFRLVPKEDTKPHAPPEEQFGGGG